MSQPISNYDQFELIFDNWEAFVKATHSLADSHPMKKYHKALFEKIKDLPEEQRDRYFKKRFD